MTKQRPETPNARSLDAPLLTFNLTDLLTQIKSEDSWRAAQCHDPGQKP